MVGFMRSLFGDRMVTNMMLKSTAISDAGITKQTLYEVSRDQFTRATSTAQWNRWTASMAKFKASSKPHGGGPNGSQKPAC